MSLKWLLAALALIARVGSPRKLIGLAGASALASFAVTFALGSTSAALRASDTVVSAVVRLQYGADRHTPPPEQRHVDISFQDAPRAMVDERFLSIAVDSSLLVGGHWWSPEGSIEPGIGRRRVPPFDFARPRLAELARALRPAYLRVGGTEADRIFYGMTEPPPASPPAPYELLLTRNEWDAMTQFVRDAGLDLFFTLNAGPSARDGEGRWQPDNAEQLLRYASARGDRIAVLELGNEINAYWFSHGPRQQPDGATVAADAWRLRALGRRYFPQALVAGPGEFFWPKAGSPFSSQTRVLDGLLEAGGGRAFDVLTWHYYPQQSRRCPIATRRASATELLEPAFLDEIARWSQEIEAKRDARGPGAALWLGETGHAQCGGEPQVSDRFVSSLWWLDELGLMAARGTKVVVRQAFVGSNYGLLDDATLEPRPDYFASVLFKKLMGTAVLDVVRSEPSDPFVRVYAHCSPAVKPGSATVLAINLHPSDWADLGWPASSAGEADVYQVTAPELTSPQALLNGRPMSAASPLLPERRTFHGPLALPPASYTFAVVDAGARACL